MPDSSREVPTTTWRAVPVDPRYNGPALEVDLGVATDVGKVREHNEDAYLVADLEKRIRIQSTNLERPQDGGVETVDEGESAYLLAVADGLGGVDGGEIASASAIRSVQQFSLHVLRWFHHICAAELNDLRDEFQQGFEKADAEIVRQSRRRAMRSMGTTLTIAHVVGREAVIAHAGDSRAYLIRAETTSDFRTRDDRSGGAARSYG